MILLVLIILIPLNLNAEDKGTEQKLSFIQNYLPKYQKPTPKEKPKPIPKKEPKVLANNPSVRHFAYNHCTFYVAQHKHITFSGNARDWFKNAQKQKYWTGQKPRMGAVLVEDLGYYGHTSIVIKAVKTYFIIREMNYAGWGIVSERKIKTNEEQIIGFIYSE